MIILQSSDNVNTKVKFLFCYDPSLLDLSGFNTQLNNGFSRIVQMYQEQDNMYRWNKPSFYIYIHMHYLNVVHV